MNLPHSWPWLYSQEMHWKVTEFFPFGTISEITENISPSSISLPNQHKISRIIHLWLAAFFLMAHYCDLILSGKSLTFTNPIRSVYASPLTMIVFTGNGSVILMNHKFLPIWNNQRNYEKGPSKTNQWEISRNTHLWLDAAFFFPLARPYSE